MSYGDDFQRLNGVAPYPYQVRVAETLRAGNNVFLRAPTGSGKTKAVLTPFLLGEWAHKPRRLIYALPLRSLAQQIHAEAAELLEKSSYTADAATIQTGEQPDDEFFDRGKVIVTTYDQVLSGLLCAPYGLSRRQANINAAAVAGALVVFDEFHLMGLRTALVTGAATLRLFDGFAQSVWMTATATGAPGDLLTDALRCVPIALSSEEMAALPAVATTTRRLRFHDSPLSAESVTSVAATGRTIVIVNQVDRAQELYEALAPWAAERGIPCLLLHARFFRPDRDARVAQLRALFGRGTKRPAILIATQAIEAGVDISCDHLFTELCPVNALLQRCGRCARFPDETGEVHVHALPDEERAWLPYGTLQDADSSLAATAALLAEQDAWLLSPDLAERWVQRIHGAADAAALASGYRARLDEALGLIGRHATAGDPVRVSHLIRDDDGASVRLIVAKDHDLPVRPALREAVAASRFRIRGLLRDDGPIGWRWDLSGEEPSWQPLATWEELRAAYVVALPPPLARYTADEGLRLGQAGDLVSPPRVPPPPKGHRPLHWEPWTYHTRTVTDVAECRWSEDGGEDGLPAAAARARLGLPPAALARAVRVCALTHDLGKLQQPWQAWAAAYQRDRDPSWQHIPLAHTDYDPNKPADHARNKRIRPVRGPHAVQGAWLALPLLVDLLDAPPEVWDVIASACLAAVVAHHGAWNPPLGSALDVSQPVEGWEALVAETLAVDRSRVRLAVSSDRRSALDKKLAVTMHPDRIEACWALVSYLTRLLRLSDQRATAEGGWSG